MCWHLTQTDIENPGPRGWPPSRAVPLPGSLALMKSLYIIVDWPCCKGQLGIELEGQDAALLGTNGLFGSV